MPRRSPYNEDYQYDDDEYEEQRRAARKFKKDNEDRQEKKKRWDKESYERPDNYDEY